MEIHQLSAQYQREQDRILLRLNTTSREELRLWLTRLLLKSWWPLLRAEVPSGVPAAAAPAPAGAPRSAPPDTAATASAAPPPSPHQAMPAPAPRLQTDFSQPFRADYLSLPLGETPLLVTEVRQQRRGERLAISFVERLEAHSNRPRAIDIDFEPVLQQGLRQLLTQTLAQAEWDLPESAPAAPPEDGGPGDMPARPTYLH